MDRRTDKTVSRETAMARSVYRFVLMMGLVSLLADVTYEGARSVYGPFLAFLGGSGLVVGVASGLGELLGYLMRLVGGLIADRTRRYWPMMWLGYTMNLLAVPALALVTALPPAIALIFTERIGKGLRTPARDTVLALAGRTIGRGYTFGLHEAIDQIGATIGPFVVAWGLYQGGYRQGFAILAVPALFALVALATAHHVQPAAATEIPEPRTRVSALRSLPPSFRMFMIFTGVHVFGFLHFPLIGFHLYRTLGWSNTVVAVAYAMAMIVDAAAAFGIGRLYDRLGIRVLWVAPVCTVIATVLCLMPLARGVVFLGVAVWGIVLGIQESIMKAAVAEVARAHQLGTAFGMFHTVYGLAWFAGGIILGGMYDTAWQGVIGIVVLSQVIAAGLLAPLQRSVVS